MSSKDYIKEILDRLMKKYQNRAARPEGGGITRRIIVKPSELYRRYADNNADISVKQAIHEAAETLSDMGMVTVDHLKFSTDIERIYLCQEKAEAIYRYLEDTYGDIPQGRLRQQAAALLDEYETGYAGPDEGSLIGTYCRTIRTQLEKPSYLPEPRLIGANLKMLKFMEENREELYVKEASMLVYGDSKWFEEQNYDEICGIARQALNMPREEDEKNDAVLAQYCILPTEQEIFIKGNWRLEWEDRVIETAGLKGGIAVLSSDMQRIKRIKASSPRLMTVENKTSYQRMQPGEAALMYLGGFAARYQIFFLKKTFQDNPGLEFWHFGDIDVGGFLIHRHLCRASGIKFRLYHMGIAQLEDDRYKPCRKKLTENDRNRIKGLMEEEAYRDVLRYMDEHDVKLEQEIISYYER